MSDVDLVNPLVQRWLQANKDAEVHLLVANRFLVYGVTGSGSGAWEVGGGDEGMMSFRASDSESKDNHD